MKTPVKKILFLGIALALLAVAGVTVWKQVRPTGPPAGLISGNGRIEATEIDVATRLAGRVVDILVREGDFVERGQEVAQMQVDVLEAQLDEARAKLQQAVHEVANAEAQVAMRESDVAAARAVVVQRESERDNAVRRLARSKDLSRRGAASVQQFDDDNAAARSAEAALTAARAQVKAAQAAVEAAKAQVTGARSQVEAARATIARIQADIADSRLKAPCRGRVQYRIAQPGEVLGAGGKVFNMIDLGDVYMTFFLPETVAGKVALDDEVRIVLDAFPDFVVPARVSFVASVAQFTPKTVETASERQKLMFRVKGRVDPKLLERHIERVKTGLPGVAWLKLDPRAEWPGNLALRLPE